ncbi:response regulator [Vibrio sp. 11986-1-5]|uniref:response regulator n=1 Tax=Vibrio sp. 11986-1-5 TaxID=2211215 RepID=UPI000D73F407|nr:transporter substrate-binding domain-containing protein [Vibrio sp. 11986-1-5]PXA73449.1 ABC transporter permease [Vibrio sp. 11986-1-5]
MSYKLCFILIFIFYAGKITAGNLVYELYPSDMVKREMNCEFDYKNISVGLVRNIGEPFLINFSSYLSGIEVDHVNLLIPCAKDKIKYVFYDSVNDAKSSMEKGEIQFFISRNNTDFSGDEYKKIKFRDDKYIGLNFNNKSFKHEEVKIGYVDECFYEELYSYGYKNVVCISYSSEKDAFIDLINNNIDILVIKKISESYFRNKFRFKDQYDVIYFKNELSNYLIYQDKDNESFLDQERLKYKWQLVKTIWSRDVSNNELTTLSEDEKKWVAEESPIIKVSFNHSFPPYTFYDYYGNESGIIPELLTSIGIKTGLRFQWVKMNDLPDIVKSIKDGIVDIVPLAAYNDDFKSKVLFSIPFSFTDISSVRRIKDEKDEIIAISSTYSLQSYISNKFQDKKIIIAKNTLSAVEMVANGKADVAYGYSHVMEFLVDIYFPGSLVSQVMQFSYQGDLRFAISKENDNAKLIQSILDKAIENLGFSYVDGLTAKWDSYLINSSEVWVDKEREIKKYYYLMLALLFSILIYTVFYFINDFKRKRRLAEYEFKSRLIDGIPIPIIVRDNESKLIHVNKAFTDFYLSTEELVLGKKTSEYRNDFLDDDFFINSEMEFFEIIKNRESVYKEITLTRNGEKLILNEWSVPYYYDGNISGVITGWIDMTEINYLNSQLIISRDEALKANRDKSNFIAVMSHEIRTPLNAIIGSLEVALIDNEKKYLNQAYTASLDLMYILKSILDISKVEFISSDLNIECVKVKNLIESVSYIFKPLSISRGIDFVIDISIDDDIEIYTEVNYLKQILNNIISNAIKYTDVGSVSVICYLMNKDINIEIIDTGIGMSQQQINNFEHPFVTESVKNDSYGLGSSIIHKLCSTLNIQLNIISEVNQGSKFHLIIPNAFKLKGLIKNDTGSQDDIDLKGKKVLVVDDYEMNCNIIERQLNTLNIDATICSSSIDAWNLIIRDQTKFDLIITDCYMPEMTGFELSEVIRSWEVKKNKKPIPILGFTANAQQETFSLCIESGMNDCIFKPVTLKLLKEKIIATLQKNYCFDMINIYRTSHEIGMPFEELMVLVSNALKDAYDNIMMPNNSSADVSNFIHKLKGITKIIGDKKILELINDFEKYKTEDALDDILLRLEFLIENIDLLK